MPYQGKTSERVTLKRSIGLPGLLFFGVGTMVGAGFYALVGKVSGLAGQLTPLSMLAAGLVALLSGFAFAELASRYPVSAGVARYVAEAFNVHWAPRLTGWLVITTGIVSAGTLAVATIGFLQDLVAIDRAAGLVLLVTALGVLAACGISQSVVLIAAITVVEVGALVAVVAFNGEHFADWRPWSGGSLAGAPAIGLFSGAFLAFYAFIGFEDMVSVAEEVREPKRTMPLAILLSIVITSLIYFLVSIVAVAGPGPGRLAASRTPVAELVTDLGAVAPLAITIVSLLAGINGALVQLLMAARVSHGMARQGDAPAWLGRVHRGTRTPVLATAAATTITLALALFFPLTTLARSTSAFILFVFAVVNLSLWRIKGQETSPPRGGFTVPRWMTMLGFLSCSSALIVALWIVVAGEP
jgi:amino acid transporter